MQGHAEISITTMKEEKNRIEDLICGLKDFDYIRRELNKFHQVVTDIYYMSKELSKEIRNNIIKYIELEEYDDMCKICKSSKSQ